MHTGGGALTLANEDEWSSKKDSENHKHEDKEKGYEEYSSKHEKDSKEHDKPHGGMHTGGGALTLVNADDWGNAKDSKYDPESYKDKDKDKESYGGKHDKGSWKHDKPRGGVHTGGGGLATSGVTAGGLAVLAVLGTGMYALRRKKAAEGVA
ncbi:hypothetical protein [Streptomyces deserti]